MKSAGKARSNGLYRHIRTSKEIIRNLLNDYNNIMFDLCQCITLNSKKVSSRQDQSRIQVQAGPTFFMDP